MPDLRDDSRDDDDDRDDDRDDAFEGASDGVDRPGGWSDEHDESPAYCPECGAVVWDAADVCPKCFSWLNGDTSRHPPGRARRRERLRSAVVWILIAAMVAGGAIFVLA